ncbi:NACHT domain-containing protein [Streptomyces doebereineriae]|uniref:NACHT domain-containing protein n=1 Tax=Streptomyces doebereineriae TaxID=3075528 RepID=A0ABU2VBU5_9ACTN|nr:NACHT domain-containing protein [Streptomyces sp. DSM 41640]MDT0483032.1 NACHT domain-containing protein [Streptomyces sp. DSM 41640]
MGVVLGAVLIVATAGYAVSQLVRGGLGPADTAGLLGLPLGVAGLVAAVAALQRPWNGTDAELVRQWAATLAVQVQENERKLRHQLLGGDIRRIDLHYTLRTVPGRTARAPMAGRTFHGSGSPGTDPDIAGFFRATRPQRLVIAGVPGSGKTVLALELVLALATDRADVDPVPVRIPMAQWDTAHTLSELLVDHLTQALDWPREMAESLVAHGMVLPVLDGLDEMDPPRADGSPDPNARRARAAVQHLNAHQAGLNAGPLVLTSRIANFEALLACEPLIDSALAVISPVATEPALTYLRERCRDHTRWQPLLDHLAAFPSGIHAEALSTPWRLGLTATVYRYHGDPAGLLALHDTDALDRHLLGRYIPAAVEPAFGDPAPPSYRPDQVHRWLHHLTGHLAGTGATAFPTTDIAVHSLWPLAGPRTVRVADALLTFCLTTAVLPVAWLTPRAAEVASSVLALAGASGLAAALALSPSRLDWQKRHVPGLRGRFVVGLVVNPVLATAVGVAAGLAVGAALAAAGCSSAALATGAVVSWVAGLGAGYRFSVAAGLRGAPTRAVSPPVALHDDTVYGLVYAVSTGLFGGLAVGGTVALLLEPRTGLVVGAATAVASGQASGLSAARRYLVFLLCSRRLLPFRLGRFLDWACSAGLMRYSGPAYQFRHAELQRWLAAHPDPVIVSQAGSVDDLRP